MANDIDDLTQHPLFDPEWYLDAYPDVRTLGIAPATHYLRYGAALGRDPGPGFSTALYRHHFGTGRSADALREYTARFGVPDVVQGQKDVTDLRKKLWGGHSEAAVAELSRITRNVHRPPEQRAHAFLLLGRFAAVRQDWDSAIGFLKNFQNIDDVFFVAARAATLLVWCEYKRGRASDARSELDRAQKMRRGDRACLTANLAEGADEQLGALNKAYRLAKLTPLALKDPNAGFQFGNLRAACAIAPKGQDGPSVSILMPVHNAAGTVRDAVDSLLEQSWRNLEIIAVDDCSTDQSWRMLQDIAKRDPRLRILRNDTNLGAYGTRNRALDVATGDFITVHDSDDWSHPETIERQVRAFQSGDGIRASFSTMARVDTDLRFSLRAEQENIAIVRRNWASLMLRRSEFERLGRWDDVRAGADAELIARLLPTCKPGSIAQLGMQAPMTLCLLHEHSLTQHSETSLLGATFGLRHTYDQHAALWHRGGAYGCTGKPLRIRFRSLRDLYRVPGPETPNSMWCSFRISACPLTTAQPPFGCGLCCGGAGLGVARRVIPLAPL